jgi:hypothetical protein
VKRQRKRVRGETLEERRRGRGRGKEIKGKRQEGKLI